MAGETKVKNIHIVDPQGHVDDDPLTLSYSGGDQAAWISDGGEFAVVFETSPFAKSVFAVSDGGTAFSDKVVVPYDPLDPKKNDYKYSVKGPKTTGIDPKIRIGP